MRTLLAHSCMFYHISHTLDQEIVWLTPRRLILWNSKRHQKLPAQKMNRFCSVVVQRDISLGAQQEDQEYQWWNESWTRCLFFTTKRMYLYKNDAFVFFSSPYSLLCLAVMTQKLFFKVAIRKMPDNRTTSSRSVSQEQTAWHHSKWWQHLPKPAFKPRIHTTCSSARGRHSYAHISFYLLCMASFAFQRKYLFWDPTVNRFYSSKPKCLVPLNTSIEIMYHKLL